MSNLQSPFPSMFGSLLDNKPIDTDKIIKEALKKHGSITAQKCKKTEIEEERSTGDLGT